MTGSAPNKTTEIAPMLDLFPADPDDIAFDPAEGRLDPLSEDGVRIGRAIDYLAAHWEDQPTLSEIASIADLSPSHFQKLFTRWAGLSPKRFCQALSADVAKQRLRDGASVLDAALEAGLSGPGRLHDLMLAVEAMTPGEVKTLGRDLEIRWGVAESAIGTVCIGMTDKGVCWLSFLTETGVEGAREELQIEFPAASLIRDDALVEPMVTAAVGLKRPSEGGLRLALKGTNFQIKVWRALLAIPPGAVVTYGDIARAIGQPTASRAVGAAVGRNPVSLIVPCHRVIQSSGVIHNYRWGTTRKTVLLGWEAGGVAA